MITCLRYIDQFRKMSLCIVIHDPKIMHSLPKEVLELVQQYVSGKAIYVPCREKQPG